MPERSSAKPELGNGENSEIPSGENKQPQGTGPCPSGIVPPRAISHIVAPERWEKSEPYEPRTVDISGSKTGITSGHRVLAYGTAIAMGKLSL
jgi:hypothetical protein